LLLAERMRLIRYTLIDHVRAPIDRVFACLADPARMATWLPACTGVEAEGPLERGARLTVRFGERVSSLEITELTAPTTFGWEEHGARKGSKTLFQLEAVRGATRITVLHWWTPHSFVAWVRGRVLVKRRVERTLNATLRNLRNALN
jgi:uncharacterized protein YndB with AHSA1/START domain